MQQPSIPATLSPPAEPAAADDRRAQVLAFVRGHVARDGYPPTVREIARGLGIPSTAHVLHHLNRLVRNGQLVRRFNTARAIAIPDAVTVFIGDDIVVELADGSRVRGRVVEPAPERIAAAA